MTILALAIVIALWAARKPKRGPEPDLVIDPARGRLELAHGGIDRAQNWSAWREWKKAGKPPLIIPLEILRGVEVRERVREDSESKSTSYVVTLVTTNPEAETTDSVEHDLNTWMLSDRAKSFADWLRGILALPNKSVAR